MELDGTKPLRIIAVGISDNADHAGQGYIAGYIVKHRWSHGWTQFVVVRITTITATLIIPFKPRT